MSRIKSRQNVEVCGDCGAYDATWASVNKGILLCVQCCSVHRSLGRHITQVKSLQKSNWHVNQLAMVTTLNNNGANNIWEHTLLENNAKNMKKKPLPQDPIQVKSEFIKAKHYLCSYAFHENYEDGLLSVENELGKQLHASVRTPNLEMSFRFLVQGADPNYFHDEKGSTPLHVAVKSDQKLQTELLLVYGADPTYPDSKGKSAIDYAKQLANKELYQRLIESQYELTDTFISYLSHRKPDHANGVHFQVAPSFSSFESNPTALAKLQKMPNHLFEELATDVYDEIDRRDTEAIWFSCVDAIDLSVVPFLPVDATLSSTRNQGRQKLARFTTPELKSLVYDILLDTQRRQLVCDKMRISKDYCQDEDPLYDSVASDDDYAALPPILEVAAPDGDDNKPTTKVQQLTRQLQESDVAMSELRQELDKLKAHVEDLKSENCELKSRLSQCKVVVVNSNSSDSRPAIIGGNGSSRSVQRPSSMYETREGLKTPNWQAMKNQLKHDDAQARNANSAISLMLTTTPTNHDRQTILDCTESITRSIQQLCRSIQGPSYDDCLSRAEKVKFSVARLASILPKEVEGEPIKLLLEFLPRIVPECCSLQEANSKNDRKAVEGHIEAIRYYAFQLAKQTKVIVTKYSSGQ